MADAIFESFGIPTKFLKQLTTTKFLGLVKYNFSCSVSFPPFIIWRRTKYVRIRVYLDSKYYCFAYIIKMFSLRTDNWQIAKSITWSAYIQYSLFYSISVLSQVGMLYRYSSSHTKTCILRHTESCFIFGLICLFRKPRVEKMYSKLMVR